MVLLGVVLLVQPVSLGASERSEQLYTKGLLPFHQQNYQAALALFQQAVAADPQDGLAVYYLGVTYGKLGQHADALPHLEQAVALQPKMFVARQDLGVAYYRVQRYSDALAQLQEADRLTPQNGVVQYYMGLCYYRLAQYPAASPPLVHVAERGTTLSHKAYYYLGLVYLAEQKLEDALAAFQTAATESPDTDVAFGALEFIQQIRQQLQAAQEQAKKDAKRWQLRLGVASKYDSNVTLRPDDVIDGAAISDKEDFGFTFSVGGSFDIWRGTSTYLSAHYDLYHTLHLDISEFDFQSHIFRLTGGWSPTQTMTLGLEGGTNYFRLDDKDYLHEFTAMPFFGFFPTSWAYTYLSYRWTDENYLISFLDPARDGMLHSVTARQYFLIDEFRQYIALGYQYYEENPSLTRGNDFQHASHQFEVGGRTPLLFDISIEASYLFRMADYSFDNSRSAFTEERDDDLHGAFVTLRRQLTSFLEVNISYAGYFNNSNIQDFEYDRNIVSLGFQVVY